MLIPLEYVQNTEERLRLYTELDAMKMKNAEKFGTKIRRPIWKITKASQ